MNPSAISEGLIIIIIIIMFLVTTDKQKSQYDYLIALETILLVRNGSRPLSGLTPDQREKANLRKG